MTNQYLRVLLSLVLVFLLSACDKAEEPATVTLAPPSQAETWPAFIDRQIEEHIAAHPQWAVVQGRHEYDGQLPDWSRAGIEKETVGHQVQCRGRRMPDMRRCRFRRRSRGCLR